MPNQLFSQCSGKCCIPHRALLLRQSKGWQLLLRMDAARGFRPATVIAAQSILLSLHLTTLSIVYLFLCIRSRGAAMALILHDRTNSDSPTIEPNKTIRRVQSSRLSHFNLDSDDTIPSEHSSIYDATAVLSEDNVNLGEDTMSPLDLHKCPTNLPLSPSLENLDQLADLPSDKSIQAQEEVPTSHSNWPTTPLETIAETRSISTLHTSTSLPHLIRSAPRPSSSDEELPNHRSASQQPSCCPPPKWSIATKPLGRRSFSENDASRLCLPIPKGSTPAYKEYQSDASSSSDELFRKHCRANWPTFPLKPFRPPPERSPTPPGLPSFGSPEAIRLMALPGSRDASARNNQGIPSQLSRVPANSRESGLPQSTPVLRSVDEPRSPKGKSVIRRIIRSCSRSSSEELGEDEAPRVSLPAGFMARADDGTYVRGRFGARSSGHGVGARTGQQCVGLEGHPFHRLWPAGRTLEEEIRKIDKACEENTRTQSPQGAESIGCQGAPGIVQSQNLQRSMVIPETGGPSRSWWSSCRSHPVNTPDILRPSEAGGPLVPPVTVDGQEEQTSTGITCESRTLLQRKFQAERGI